MSSAIIPAFQILNCTHFFFSPFQKLFKRFPLVSVPNKCLILKQTGNGFLHRFRACEKGKEKRINVLQAAVCFPARIASHAVLALPIVCGSLRALCASVLACAVYWLFGNLHTVLLVLTVNERIVNVQSVGLFLSLSDFIILRCNDISRWNIAQSYNVFFGEYATLQRVSAVVWYNAEVVYLTVSEKQKAYRDKWDAANMAYQTVKVRRSTLDQFRELCSANGDRVNTVMRKAIEDYIEQHKSQG